jgi:hypothetical protein
MYIAIFYLVGKFYIYNFSNILEKEVNNDIGLYFLYLFVTFLNNDLITEYFKRVRNEPDKIDLLQI